MRKLDPGIMVCNSPLATAIKPSTFLSHCHCCFRSKGFAGTKRCTGCRFVRYCSADCQKKDWQAGHKFECKFLKQGTDKDPELTQMRDRLFKAMNGETNVAICLMVFRLFLLSQHDKLASFEGKSTKRRWSDLMSHEVEIRKSPEKMTLFHTISGLIFVELRQRNDIQANAELFSIFGKVAVNSHSLVEWDERGQCNQIGLALSLDISAFDHSCAPNVDLFCMGSTTFAIPIEQGCDTHKASESFIPYTNLLSPKWVRRQFLKENYFFDCNCSRCASTEDDILTSFLCEYCQKPVPYRERNPLVKLPVDGDPDPTVTCPHCQKEQAGKWISKAIRMMQTLRGYVGTGCAAINEKDEDFIVKQKYLASLTSSDRTKLLLDLKEKSNSLLPESNAYLSILYYLIIQNGHIETSEMIDLLSSYYTSLLRTYPFGQSKDLLTELFFICETMLRFGAKDRAMKVLAHIKEIVGRLVAIDQWCLIDDLTKKLQRFADGEITSLDD